MEFEPSAQQRTAVEAPIGPTLVLAGPGAGKTFCLIGRITHLIEAHDARPDRVCAVTFTNKAAEEVAFRLKRRLGQTAEDLACGTLHSRCLGILRDYSEEAGLRRGFGVADAEYQELVLLRLGVRDPWERKRLLRTFGLRRLESSELEEADEPIFDNYLSVLREKNLVDFDDLISITADLLRRHPEIAGEVAGRWDHLLVDEFQDLDASQYAIIKRLAEDHRSLFAVGDDEQSIFGWRGSNPNILWRFLNDFGIDDPIPLDRNYRCSREIFSAARRLIASNPDLFSKEIEAVRESRFEVEGVAFEDDEIEAAWIANHLIASRLKHGTGWGDFALLYRRHRIGERLEDQLITAGIPCRLARGQSLLDDEVVAYVIASLRVMIAPDDPLAVEAFAERVLQRDRNFLPAMRTRARQWDAELLQAMRRFARSGPRHHPDRKKAWRFIYHMENLRALYRQHSNLLALIEALLSERVRPYGNALEERHEDVSDPAIYPGAELLAEWLRRAVAAGDTILLEARDGAEIALKGMLEAAEVPSPVEYAPVGQEPGPGERALGRELCPRPTTLFKALQLIHGREFSEGFDDFVAFDLETTDRNPSACGIVEIAAARVRDGEVTETFRSLVNPGMPISARASEVHGYTDEDVTEAPSFQEVWPSFREFVGDDILMAHNGQMFDIPVLRRIAGEFAAVDDLVFFDTLPLARSLYAGHAKLEALAERFDVDLAHAHHAHDDAVALANVFRALSRERVTRARKAALANILDYLAIGLVLDPAGPDDEDGLLLELARPYALGRYSDSLDFYAAERAAGRRLDVPSAEEVIERLGGRALMDRIRAERSAEERYPAALARLRSLVEAAGEVTLDGSIRALLERVALSTSEGVEADPHRVNLLTLHAAKGLEFDHVYIVGVEDYEIPGYRVMEENRTAEIEEARRLLYVGMTRARERLILTRVEHRRGRPAGGSMFLNEIGVVPVRQPIPVGSSS